MIIEPESHCVYCDWYGDIVVLVGRCYEPFNGTDTWVYASTNDEVRYSDLCPKDLSLTYLSEL